MAPTRRTSSLKVALSDVLLDSTFRQLDNNQLKQIISAWKFP